jgi:hypothetical protein
MQQEARRAVTKRALLTLTQKRLLRLLRRHGTLNLAAGTALLRTARALEKRGRVWLQRNPSINGYDAGTIDP